MTRTPDASAAHHDLRQRLLALLADGDVDAALQAGLMDFPSDRDDEDDAPLRQIQARLREAWAARDRHRAREARLARIAAEREARRRAASAPAIDAAAPGTPPAAPALALPPAAAAALARARARAGGGRPA
ncbi:hypothetical protein [Pseudoxanthomonas sp.]|uniref:hypothetical protein n=1 Tax=Pseudoxanthomonas sp. TaxID=1871049 RepID=UPI002588F51E|nr:hypothetical protein [Pseudoxanthomonas sp.]MCR6685262.1 hypothetical protein [Pseudoxanthomonas sp.]